MRKYRILISSHHITSHLISSYLILSYLVFSSILCSFPVYSNAKNNLISSLQSVLSYRFELQDLHVTETMPQLIGLSEAYILIYERKGEK